MLIWGGNCPMSYKNVTNKTKIKESHLMFIYVREKLDRIIFSNDEMWTKNKMESQKKQIKWSFICEIK
jgi:hypothetical protein